MSGPKQKRQPNVFRPGKTREDRMPVGERPRVAAAQQRREAMQRETK